MRDVYVQSITILFNQYSYSFIDGITVLCSTTENPTMFYCVFISHSLCSVMNKKIYCSFMVLSVLPFPVIEESRG